MMATVGSKAKSIKGPNAKAFLELGLGVQWRGWRGDELGLDWASVSV